LLVEVSQKKTELLQLNDSAATKESTKNVSLFFGWKSMGTFATAYLSGFLLEKIGKHTIFWFTSFFPLTLSFVALFLDE
jgi:hypothetical protein